MKVKLFDQKLENFIAALDKSTIAKTLRTLNLLEKFGNKLGMPHSKRIDTDLFELRIRGKKEVRIIYCFQQNTIILLHGFIKKTQKIPKKSLFLAKKRLNSIDRI